jgi:CxxC motif-containing protein (DUF1111 family)
MKRTSLWLVALQVGCAEPSYTKLGDTDPATDAGGERSPREANIEGAASPSDGTASNSDSAEVPSAPTADGSDDAEEHDATAGGNDESEPDLAPQSESADETSESDEPSQSDETDGPESGPGVAPGGDGCESRDVLPASFARNCAGCHSASGSQVGSAPNLFGFAGGPGGFSERVRAGGMTMPSFDEAALSGEDLAAIASYFSADTVASPDSEPTSCTEAGLLGDECSGVDVAILPLYVASATEKPPLLSQSEDGTLTLRAGGRVRGRHEQEGDFSPYHAQYFENRSYTFILEDTIPAGGNTVKVTWLPIADAAADQVINLRYWYTGDGNVFHTNVGMTRVGSLHWEHTAERNAREEREIQAGDRLEFEFGVFYDPALVEGRTSYYSDTFRYVVGSGELSPFDAPDASALSGGDTTIPYVVVEPELYFEQMALNIQGDNAQQFLEGRRLFHTDFVSGEHTEGGNPVFDAQAGKAGPLANQASCAGCHERNGRGAPPTDGAVADTLVFKTFELESSSDAPLEHTLLGRQLQTQGNDGMDPEGSVTVTHSERVFQFPDGSEVSLQVPSYAPSLGDVLLSPRLPRPVIGLGLLEAVAESTLLSFADALDCNGDGVSGRPNIVPDPQNGALRIGRFGWKAGKVNVRHQVADALQLDLGVTTSLLPMLDCGAASCGAEDEPELSDEELGRLETYTRLLAVPPRRDTANDSVKRGEDLFLQVGCARCHVPTLTTGTLHPLLELRGQVIHPYTDLLLHDLGPELADPGAGEYRAEAGEWRTPPLWGLGLAATINGEVHLLHDGRAATPLEAILWHGGEAEAARDAFTQLTSAERADLLAFLDSL